jgi:hypothetical protein
MRRRERPEKCGLGAGVPGLLAVRRLILREIPG